MDNKAKEIKINWELSLDETNLLLDLISNLPINKGADLFYRLKRESELQFQEQTKKSDDSNRTTNTTDIQE